MNSSSVNKKLEVLCYVEGYSIPVKSIAISTQVGVPSVATITIPPAKEAEELFPTTHIAIFVRYAKYGDQRPMVDQYTLLFHGEISGVRAGKSGINANCQILAVDSRTYLNRLPGKMLYKLYGDPISFYPNFKEDGEFYGIPNDTATEAYFQSMGLMMKASSQTLEKYVGQTLSLVKYKETGAYKYYANAEARFNISGNHSIRDYGDVFKKMWGALYNSSLINNTNQNMIRYDSTIYDSLVSNLAPMGYQFTSVTAPMHVSGGNGGCLKEYIVTRDMINHRAPKFNYAYVDRDDNFDAMIAYARTTAMKYKYKTKDNTYPIEDSSYPKGCMDAKGHSLVMTEYEKLIGISRESVDMEYFYNAFLRDAAEDKGGNYYNGSKPAEAERKSILESKLAYDFTVKTLARNGLSLAKMGLYLQYALGMPTIVYDPMTDRAYRGNISKLSYAINVEAGQVSTAMEAINADRIPKRRPGDTYDWQEIDEGRKDYNPYGASAFIPEESNFYKEHYYGTDYIQDPLATSSMLRPGTPGAEDYETQTTRKMCTMREYLSMYYAPGDVIPNDVPPDIFESYRSNTAHAPHELIFHTFGVNASMSFMDIDSGSSAGAKMNLLFIGDRRTKAKALQDALSRRILYV